MQLQNKLVIVKIALTDTNKFIAETMRKMRTLRHQPRKTSIICLVDGFDDDKRELYQIPEARALFRRLVKLGLISYLEVHVTLPHSDPALSHGLGALEIWSMSEGIVRSQNQEIPKETFITFFRELEKSNERAEKLIGPYSEA